MILKSLSRNFYFNSTLLIIIFFLDRISKIYVIYLSDKLNQYELFSSNFLNISLIWNEGIAFGLFSFDEKFFYNLLTIFISLVILMLFILVIKNDNLKNYALLMIIGGALGNLYDRIFYKAVPDFLDFHINSFHWFIFNVADIFITLGVFFMILLEFFDKNKRINESN